MLININHCPSQGRVNNPNSYLTLKPASPLNHSVLEFWQLNVPDGKYSYRSVPDNCVDIIINLTLPEEMFIVTPFSSAKVFEMIGPISYFGIRFCILGHQAIVKMPLGEWTHVDKVASIDDVLPKHLFSALYNIAHQTMPFKKRCDCISQVLLAGLSPSELDPRLIRYILYCDRNITSDIDLSHKQCSKFGISARHLRRLTAQYLGLSPREFASVFRFQKTLRGMNIEGYANVWPHYYYDQSHFNRNFKDMSGVTPNEFMTMSVLYNTD